MSTPSLFFIYNLWFDLIKTSNTSIRSFYAVFLLVLDSFTFIFIQSWNYSILFATPEIDLNFFSDLGFSTCTIFASGES